MVTPNLSQKQTIVLTTTEMAKKLFQTVYFNERHQAKEDDEAKIRVSETISRMSFYYEKIRNSVDYKEEHLLLKEAISRGLNRLISIEQQKDEKLIARDLLIELIRAGYLANNKIPETEIIPVGAIVKKYLQLKAMAKTRTLVVDKRELGDWLMSLAACELEDHLNPKEINNQVVKSMYETLAPLLELPADSPLGKDKEIQLYVSIYRSYLRADEDIVSFVLFKYLVPDWLVADDSIITGAAEKIDDLVKTIHYHLEHPLALQLNRLVARYTVFFSILTEVIAESPTEVYDSLKKDPKAFPRRIKHICAKRYKSVKRKLWRAAVRSIIYLFITKMLLVFVLEIPVANFLGQPVNDFSLGINVTFPPLLLFLIVLFTRTPGDVNTAKIVEGIEQLTFVEKARREPFKLRPAAGRSAAKGFVFSLLYIITFFLSFGVVVWLLDRIGFHFVSITIFLFFLALISFFSIRIRKRVRELLVVDPKENIFGLLMDFFSVPIIAAGKWISEKFAKINVLVFILDFLIEAPFKLFVEVAEEWTKYVKERKEDISQ
jgi:hypothetical protein